MSANMQITNNMVAIRPPETGIPGQPGGGGQIPGLAGFSQGDTVSAEVVSVSGDSVNLALPDGTEVKSQFPEGVPARPGDLVDLTLVAKNQNGVQLRLTAINGQSVHLEASSAEIYLMDRGIPPTQLNSAAAQVFVRNQITPTPKNVANLIEIAAKLPDVPTSVAVMMAENNVPPTKENAAILMKWANGPAALARDVAGLESAVARQGGVARFANVFQSNLSGEASPQLARTIMQAPGFEQLAQQLSGMTGGDAQPAQQAVQNFVATLNLPPQDQQAAQHALNQAFAQTAEQLGDPVQPDASQTAAPEQTQHTPGQQSAAQPAADGTAQQTPQVRGEQTAQNVQAQTPGASSSGDARGAQQPQNTPQTQSAQPDTVSTEQEAAAQAARQALQSRHGADAKQVQKQEAAPEQPKAEQQGPHRINTPVNEPDGGRPRTTTLERSPEAQMRQEASQILSNLHKFVVRARGGQESVQEDGKALQQGVRQQQELANMTKASVSRLFGQDTPAAQRANELSSQVRLGNQLDQFFYAQIPFQTPQQQGTADLYVLKRNPEKSAEERTNTTIMIGLDTQHMGRVESILRSADGRLSVEFRVASRAIQRFFEDSVRSFCQEMEESGFPLDGVRVSQIREKVTPLNAMKVMEPKKEVRLRGLDIEA